MGSMKSVLVAAAMFGAAGAAPSKEYALPVSKPEKKRREEATAKIKKAEEKRERRRQRNLEIEARQKRVKKQ